ncbi:MAG: TetR/AcrR family transcriptional regulator [Chloroflexota bacterium]
MARKTKQDWLDEGLALLEEEGAGRLKIDVLKARLGVTKGSFYHHFKNFQDYKTNLLAYYEEARTLQVIALVEGEETAVQRLNRIFDVTAQASAKLEVALRAWSLQDDEVRQYQTRIDTQRLGYAKALFFEMTQDKQQAKLMSQILYTLYIGCSQLLPPIQGDSLDDLYEEFKRLYGLD